MRHTKKFDKRLERLICSGLRSTKDVEAYVDELRQLAERLGNPDFVRRQSRLLKALANQTRLKMLWLLSAREMCVCELIIALDLTQPTASHHLNILQNVGLVKDRKESKWVFYRIAEPEALKDLFDFLRFPS